MPQTPRKDLVLVRAGDREIFAQKGTAPAGSTNLGSPLTVNEHMFIEGYYYDDDKNRTAFFVTLQDEFGKPITSYLAQLTDKTDTESLPGGVRVALLGPQFYEAYKNMSVKVTVLRFGEDNKGLKLFETVKKYADVAAKFVPVINQALGYAEMGLEVLKEQLGKDAVYEFKFDIARQDKSPATSESWFLFSGGKVAPKLTALTSFDVDTSGGRRHILWPASVGKPDGYAMFIGVYREPPVEPYKQVLEYLRLMQEKYSAYLREKPIKAGAIDSSDAAVQNAQVAHLWNAFWARLEIAGTAPQNSTEEGVKELFDFASRLSTLTAAGPNGALVKLTPEKEREFAGALSGIFKFTINSTGVAAEGEDTRESGFQRLARWATWFNKRYEYNKTLTAGSPRVFTWSERDQTLYPYAIATDEYARNEAQKKVADAVGDKQILTGGDLRKLDSLSDFFSLSPQEPWLFYEQKSVAMWLNNKFNLGKDVPPVTMDSSPADVRAFGEKFKSKLADAKVLKLDGSKWGVYSPVKFVWDDNFLSGLKSIAGKEEEAKFLSLNQHEDLVKLYNTWLNGKASLLSEEEKKEVEAKFLALLVESDLKKVFEEKKAGALFANYILRVENDTSPRIIRVKFPIDSFITLYDRMCESPDSLLPKDAPKAVKTSLLEYLKNPDRLQEISDQFVGSENSGLDLSVRQRGVRFLQTIVPGLKEKSTLKGVPKSAAEAKAWSEAFVGEKGIEWFEGGGCRFEYKSTRLDEIRLNGLETRFSQFNQLTDKTEMKSFIRDVMKYAFTDAGPTKPSSIRQRAIAILMDKTVLPPALAAADVREAATWDSLLGMDLDWGKDCKKIVVTGVGCIPAAPPLQ